jgi:hypothetical protein
VSEIPNNSSKLFITHIKECMKMDLKLSELGVLELLFVVFLYLLTILNTLSTVIDDIIPFGSRRRPNFQDL